MLIDITKLDGVTAVFNHTPLTGMTVYSVATNAIDNDLNSFCGLYGKDPQKYQIATYNLTITLPELYTIKRVQVMRYYGYNPYDGISCKEYIETSDGGSWTTKWSDLSALPDGVKTIDQSGIWANVRLIRFRTLFVGLQNYKHGTHKLFDFKVYADYESPVNFEDSLISLQENGQIVKLAVRVPAEEWETVAVARQFDTQMLALVEPSSPAASKLRVMTAAGVMAVAKYSG